MKGWILINKIGQRIKELRVSKGMSQEELGRILGVTKSAVQKYESGQTTNLRADKIKLLCETFEVFPRYFIYEDHNHLMELLFGKKSAGGDPVILKDEQVVVRILKNNVGLELLKLMTDISYLNSKGLERVKELVRDLNRIEEYQKNNISELTERRSD